MIPLKDENPTERFPLITVLFMATNILVFLYQVVQGPEGYELTTRRLGAVPYEIIHFVDVHPESFLPPPLTLFTAMFMHGGWLHLGGNMLYLWIFGNNVEDYLGKVRFIIFYLTCGLVASLAHALTNPDSLIPMVGASGAIAGVLGAYTLLYPRARVLTLVPIFIFIQFIYLPAFVFLGLWFLLQLLNAPSGGQVAWYAHIGGFLAGTAFIWPFWRRRRPHLYRRRAPLAATKSHARGRGRKIKIRW